MKFFLYYKCPLSEILLYILSLSHSVADRISLPAEGSGNGTLTISDTHVADSSPYQCTAVNSAGSASSTTVQLRVIGTFVTDLSPSLSYTLTLTYLLRTYLLYT